MTGFDFTDKMAKFSETLLNSLDAVDGFILKSASPSSGFKNVKVYPSIERVSPIEKPWLLWESSSSEISKLAN